MDRDYLTKHIDDEYPTDEKEVWDFIDSITPKNWHILTDLKDIKPGHLYIQYLYSGRNKGQVVGSTKHLHIFEKVAFCDLWLHYDYQWRITIIHELAHIAVNRWWSWKTHNDILVNYGAGKRIKHDKIFKKAEDILYKRAIKTEGHHGIQKAGQFLLD